MLSATAPKAQRFSWHPSLGISISEQYRRPTRRPSLEAINTSSTRGLRRSHIPQPSFPSFMKNCWVISWDSRELLPRGRCLYHPGNVSYFEPGSSQEELETYLPGLQEKAIPQLCAPLCATSAGPELVTGPLLQLAVNLSQFKGFTSTLGQERHSWEGPIARIKCQIQVCWSGLPM